MTLSLKWKRRIRPLLVLIYGEHSVRANWDPVRFTAKPRIQRFYGAWRCISSQYVGVGATPEAAYRKWDEWRMKHIYGQAFALYPG